jgi:hypothetical protein
MKRELIILVEPLNGPKGSIDLCFGTRSRMKEIATDHLSVKGNSVISIPIDGPALTIQALDVAWGIQDEVIPGSSEGSAGLKTLLTEVVIAAAQDHELILNALLPVQMPIRRCKTRK